MYVYIWKDPYGVPFYVGLGSTLGRANPKAKRHRNKACVKKLQEIGADSVVVEIHSADGEVAAQLLEKHFIEMYGRLKDGGTLTNISRGGEFHRTSKETREKLVSRWQDTEHRERTKRAKTGLKRNLPESTKAILRENIAKNPAMKGWGERNGKDADFEAKRIAGLRASMSKRTEKMAEPERKERRIAALKATLGSPEFKAKREEWDTPEYRAKLSAARKAYWDAWRAKKAAG